MRFSFKISILLYILTQFFFQSCNNQTGNSDNDPSSNALSESFAPVSAGRMEKGQLVYKTHCFACHQTTGTGIPKLYPPLANNKTVVGDKTFLISILLNGMSGEIVVNGEKYNQVMIPHDFLSDQQLADVLTYIRNSFGNRADEIKASEVQKLRRENNSEK